MSELRPRRMKFWGWGFEGEGATPEEKKLVLGLARHRYGIDAAEAPAPREEEFDLPKPRIAPPASLASLCSSARIDRLAHACGKSFPDAARIAARRIDAAPDLVAYPRNEADVAALLDWAASARIAVVPYGGGSSVVGGVEPQVGAGFAGALSIDLGLLDKVLEVDPTSRAARIQAGVLGPALEAQLAPHGLTLRHFPQSFQYSSLGGWIATRSGGHFATLGTHIDDFVETARMLTPKGAMQARRLPGGGAGPDPNRLVIGSEGALGIVTEAWMRLQAKPRFRAGTSAHFADFDKAVGAVRAIVQAGLWPANLRLLDRNEARNTLAGDGSADVLVLAFESADHDQMPKMRRALECVGDFGGRWDERQLAAGQGGHREGASGAWRNAFLRAPFFREITTPLGIIVDTFETSITWERFFDFHAKVKAATEAALKRATGNEGSVTCRFTHVYPDGPAPYFTFMVKGDKTRLVEQWREIKVVASDALAAAGGTITHHHAVGRDHMPWYRKEIPALYGAALAAAKRVVDPAGVMNPGVLVG